MNEPRPPRRLWQPLPQGDPGPRRVADSLDRVASSLGAPSADVLTAVFNGWTDVVGEAVARHCRPLSLRGNVLVVGADEPAWAAELRWLEADLLARLAEVIGPDRLSSIEVVVSRRQ